MPGLRLEWGGIVKSQRLADWQAPLATARALHGVGARLRLKDYGASRSARQGLF